jgi:hypothetical protein
MRSAITFGRECKTIAAILFCLALVVVPWTASRLNAQTLYGSIVGEVTDPSGGVIPNAVVTVTQKETGAKRTVQADRSGTYTISTVPAGTYDVQITAPGFKTFENPNVTLSINRVVRVDASLQVGATGQTVQVTGGTPLLQTDRADVRQDITSTEIRSVPLAPGNNYEQLFRALPGFNPPKSAHSVATNPSRALQFNVNGTSDLTNDVRVDGVSQYNIWVPENTAYIPSSDAIQTVNVVTGNFNPEQGIAGGSAINVQIRSGTNSMHGDLYEYHYDNNTEASPWAEHPTALTRNPKDIFNQFGGSIGGPIKKNKLFYFANVEATRQRQFATHEGTVPTAAMRAGDLTLAPKSSIYDPATGGTDGSSRTAIYSTSNPADTAHFNALCTSTTTCPDMIPTSRLSPIAQKLLAMLPLPNISPFGTGSASKGPSNNFQTGADVAFNRLTNDDKIDWNATDKLTMYGHVGVLTYNTFNPQMFGALGGPEISDFIGNEGTAYGHTVTLSTNATYVFSPTFIIDGNAGFTRMVANSEQLDIATDEGQKLGIPGTNGSRPFEGSWPEFDISNFSLLGTQHNFMPYFRNDPQINYSANATWIHGSHNVRFGFNFIDQHLNEQQPEWNAGGTSWPAAGGFAFGSGPTQTKVSGKTTSSTAYNDLATFLLGLDTQWGRNIQIPDYFHTATHEYGTYLGDTWQTTSNLTTTLGIRWEYYPMPVRQGTQGLERYNFDNNTMWNCGEGGFPTDCGVSLSKKYFSPRLGLAYRLGPSFVVRAGYGITYDPFNLVDDLRTNYPILIPLNQTSPSSLLAAGVLDSASEGNAPVGQGPLPVGIVPPNPLPSLTAASVPVPTNVNLVTTADTVRRGYIQSANLTLEKEMAGGWVAQVGYVGTRSVRQLGMLNLNVGNPNVCYTLKGKYQCGGTASEPLDIKFKRANATSLVTPITHNKYDSLQAQLSHRFANGFQMQSNYTWSKSMGMCGASDEKSNGPCIPLLPYQYLNAGLSPLDQEQNFETLFIIDSPFGANQRWATGGMAGTILGNWQLSGLLSAISGGVFEFTASGTSLNAPGNDQRPDLVGPIKVTGAVGTSGTWFDTSAFQAVNTQRFGTSPFYALHGPGIFNLDAGLQRTFKTSERTSLDIRAQAFNLTNTPHFGNPSGSCGGTISSTDLACSSSSFGIVSGTTNLARDGIDQRQFEFMARFSF